MAKTVKTTSQNKSIPVKEKAAVKKATKKDSHKRRVKGTSETDNPKYANKDLMLSLIESAAQKEDAKVEKKLARKAHVVKIIEEKDAKKDAKEEAKKEKLEKVKQGYLEAQKRKKAEARKQKQKTKVEAMRKKSQPAETAPKKKKSVRFA